MNKKLVTKLISTVLSLTMVLGMSMTVFADSHTAEHSTVVGGKKNDTYHNLICTQEGCDDRNNPVGEENHSLAYIKPVSATSHANYCYVCEETYGSEEAHSGGSLEWVSYTEHGKRCEDCNAAYETASHVDSGAWKVTDCTTYHYKVCSECNGWGFYGEHSFGSDGKCSTCGYTKSYSNSSSTEEPKPTAEQIAEEVAKAVEAKEAEEVALSVSAFETPAPAAVASSLPVGTYNLSNVTTTKGFVSAVSKIAKSSPASIVTVYSAKPIAFNNDSLTAVSNTGKAFTYVFNYKGVTYSVTIPAGANVKGLLGNGKFAGPLYLGSLFGTTTVVK